MTLFCVAFLVDAVGDTYIIGCLTTIERRFQFASKYSGLLLSGSTVAQMFSVLAGSYLGRRRQPAFLAIGALLSAAGRLLFATPHFVYGAGAAAGGRDGNASEYEMCLAGREEEEEEAAETECSSANQVAYAMMVAGMVLSGAGGSCLFSLGTSYVDDNLVNPRAAPLCLSVIYTMRALGPAIGFPLAGLFSKIYVDFSDTDLTPNDPQWIGAWWLGLPIFSGITFACALPFAMFPNYLRSNATAHNKSNVAVEHIDCDLQEHQKDEEIVEMIYYHPREFLRAMRRLLTNGLYVCVVLGVCFQFYSIIGYFAFLPKYLESYFGTTTAVSNIVVDGPALLTADVGVEKHELSAEVNDNERGARQS
ncbi:PREDICTED: solute carrier organic anion transporter family member 2A1-like [Priapulus caudatus]|uniref:Solute carrier organic anion transporter family member 2A1-like n=1 Tax=Priapulus caudatus TaxID=37621 RepID=A0ABM1ES01_PRICU|nr:PREDICTED: solute carrier organic anion transporter family member 2A1-like [Priapulus caudatus]